MREINPGQIVEKIERTIGLGLRQEHRDDPKGGIVALANNGGLPFILLGVAKPVRSDEHNRGLGGADGLFQRPNPRQPRRQIAAIEE